jgi:hypothetical protein
MDTTHPTPYREVNRVLLELLSDVQTVLGDHFVGMYLFGSLAGGDFDEDSDIDFVVVTNDDISDTLFSGLQTAHMRIAMIECWCATELEGCYLPQRALRRYIRTDALYPHIDRGKGERLRMKPQDSDWTIHGHMLRETGVVVTGPAPHTLIDPVTPIELRRAVLDILRGWWAPMLDDSLKLNSCGYQSYAVLTMCRMLYTLAFGTIVSKRVAARWAKETLGEQWMPLIDRAWVGRHNPELKAHMEDVNATLELIHDTLERTAQATS